jgi:hypothetical protein
MRRSVAYSAVGSFVAVLLAAEPAARSWSEPTFATVTMPHEMADTVWDIEVDAHPFRPEGPVLRGRLWIGRIRASTPPSLTRDWLSGVYPAFITLESDPAVERALESGYRAFYLERLHLARAEGKPDPEWEPMPPGIGAPFPTGQQMIEIQADVDVLLPPFFERPGTFTLALPGRVGPLGDPTWFGGQMSPGLFEGSLNRVAGCFPPTKTSRPFRMRRIA